MTVEDLVDVLAGTFIDVLIAASVLFTFYWGLTRKAPPRLWGLLVGLSHLIAGLFLFKVGLELSVLPIGKELAEQLSGPVLNRPNGWFRGVLPLCVFAVLLGFSATLIEPTLIAVGDRVQALSGGAIDPWRLRLMVATGVAIGLLLGTLRTLLGIPMELVVSVLVGVLAFLSFNAPRELGPIAIDSGGMATSVVVVPLIAAFGVAVAETMPGRDPIRDGFGMIVLALLMPGIVVLAVAKIEARLRSIRNV
jgi:hypothetical protein